MANLEAFSKGATMLPKEEQCSLGWKENKPKLPCRSAMGSGLLLFSSSLGTIEKPILKNIKKEKRKKKKVFFNKLDF